MYILLNRYRDTEIRRYRDTEIPIYRDIEISRYYDTDNNTDYSDLTHARLVVDLKPGTFLLLLLLLFFGDEEEVLGDGVDGQCKDLNTTDHNFD
jgi:hypothetical protein